MDVRLEAIKGLGDLVRFKPPFHKDKYGEPCASTWGHPYNPEGLITPITETASPCGDNCNMYYRLVRIFEDNNRQPKGEVELVRIFPAG